MIEAYPEAFFQIRGGRGYTAALRGDTAQARRDVEWLTDLQTPYLHGQHRFFSASIVAALG